MVSLRSPISLVVITLVLALSSCSSPTPAAPASTQTSLPTSPPTLTQAPTAEPTLAPSPAPSEVPTITPSSVSFYLPIGVATVRSADGQVSLYDFQGQHLGDLQAPDIGTGIMQQAHLAGPLTGSPNPTLPPMVYYAFKNGGELWLNDNNNLSLLRATPNLFNMIGLPGKPTLAYSQVEYTDNGVRSLVFLGDSQSLASANSILDSTNSQSYAIKLMAISVNNEQPTGLWYTTVPYGIGGNIVFEPRMGLYSLDLATSGINSYLDLGKSPAGISDDQTWVAFTKTSGISPLTLAHNFDFSTAVTIPLREDSDRGAGDAVFSPDNKYAAWREASGGLTDPTVPVRQTIRIATLDGTIVSEIDGTSLAAVSGLADIGWVVPISWIGPQTLVLEVKDVAGSNASVLSISFDGSAPALLAPGSFLGFLYP